jgi:hypothetical protein
MVSPRSHSFVMWHLLVFSTSLTSAEIVVFQMVGDVAGEMGDIELPGC